MLLDIISHVVNTYASQNTSQSNDLKYTHNIPLTFVKNSIDFEGYICLTRDQYIHTSYRDVKLLKKVFGSSDILFQ